MSKKKRIEQLELAVLHLLVLQYRQFVSLTHGGKGKLKKLRSIERRLHGYSENSTEKVLEDLADRVLGEDG